MVGGMAALLIGVIYLPAGKILGLIPWLCAKFMTAVVAVFAGIRGSEWQIELGIVGLLIFYVVIAALFVFRKRILDWVNRIGFGWLAIVLMIFSVLLLVDGIDRVDNRLQITFLDAGEGCGILVKTPENRYVLIGGGNDRNALADALGARLPFLSNDLDYWIVANNHEENLSAFAGMIETYSPKDVLWAANLEGTRYVREMMVAWEADGFETIFVEDGQKLDLGDGATLTILAIGRNGAVLSIDYKDFSMILPLGLDFDLLPELEGYLHGHSPDAYLLADGGFGPLNPPELLNTLDAVVYIIEVDSDDGIDRPLIEMLEFLKDEVLLRTDLDGWINISTDGEQLWVETENKP